MKFTTFLAFLAFALLLPAGCQPGRNLTDNDTIAQEVLSAHRQVVQAAENRDADAMFSLILDNNGVILQNGLFRDGRQSALNATRDGFAGLTGLTYQFDREVVEVLSPDKALLKAAGTSIAHTSDGREFKTPFCETIIFTKTPDGWKILHAHHSTPAR